jgi:uncharacterized protein HemX
MTDKKEDSGGTQTTVMNAEPMDSQSSGAPEGGQAAVSASRRGGRGLAGLALLVALAAGAGSGYLWYLWDKDKRSQVSESVALDERLQKLATQVAQEREAELKTLRDRLASHQADTQALGSESQTLKGNLRSLQSTVQNLAGDLQTVQNEMEIQKGNSQIRKQQIQALQDQTQALQGNLQSLNDQFGKYGEEQKRNWSQLETRMENVQLAERSLLTTLDNVRAVVARGGDVNALTLAEVEYLLRVADYKLKLQRDVRGAIEALTIAEQRLKMVDESAFLPVQRMLAENIASLRGVDLPDRSALAHKIIEMEQRVNSLPLRNQAQLAGLKEKVKPHVGEAETQAAASLESWRDKFNAAAAAAWEHLKDIVVIRHERSSAPPLIAIEEQYFLIQNLKLELEAMRLALLNNNASSYQESNELARDWLQTYFDDQDAAVSEFLAELKALQAIQFNPYIPDISGTLRAFGDIMERRQPVRSITPSTSLVPPSATGTTGPAEAKEAPQ